MRINLFQNLIDIIRGKKKLAFISHIEMYNVQRKYPKIARKLAKKVKNREKIRVCFSVVFDSVFSAKPVFEKMLEDEMFEPFILVIPDVSRGEENMFYQMDKTYKALSSQYKEVYRSYDYDKKEFTDWSDKSDMVFFANPYDSMTHKLYKIEHAAKCQKLCLYTSYGYVASNLHYSLYSDTEFNCLWKIYALEKYEYDALRKNLLNPNAAKLAGYCKMDSLVKINSIERNRKKIIIAPHHTIGSDGLAMSNFLKYYEFFLEIPKKYPDIDFVFRPHPLLFVTVINNKIWTKEKVEKYISCMKAIPNVEYQDGGDYFDTFVNSDGIIHDCGSFSAEYLFTSHPCCHLSKTKINDAGSNEFHRQCIKQYYEAFTEEDVINFIENVIIQGKDVMKQKRNEFFEKVLRNNYPNTSDYIFNDIKRELEI